MSKDQRRGIVGIVAVLYGLGVAFGPNLVDNDGLWKLWLAIGAFVVGALWLALMVLPWAQARTDRPS
ncbi:hypothetical protein [Nostocoides vanveenii]|uniref:DUF4175 domain-containing protein n=1 Tax=Nostocoides vanveenii TaxID=330835 RepID=A0ABN2K611_9MICO